MRKRWNSFARKMAPVLTAGMLLQAAGCEFNTDELVGGLFTTVVSTLLSSFVFGAFGLV